MQDICAAIPENKIFVSVFDPNLWGMLDVEYQHLM
jgi:hypothetical protein